MLARKNHTHIFVNICRYNPSFHPLTEFLPFVYFQAEIYRRESSMDDKETEMLARKNARRLQSVLGAPDTSAASAAGVPPTPLVSGYYPERVLTTSFVVLSIGNSKSNRLGAQGTFIYMYIYAYIHTSPSGLGLTPPLVCEIGA